MRSPAGFAAVVIGLLAATVAPAATAVSPALPGIRNPVGRVLDGWMRGAVPPGPVTITLSPDGRRVLEASSPRTRFPCRNGLTDHTTVHFAGSAPVGAGGRFHLVTISQGPVVRVTQQWDGRLNADRTVARGVYRTSTSPHRCDTGPVAFRASLVTYEGTTAQAEPLTLTRVAWGRFRVRTRVLLPCEVGTVMRRIDGIVPAAGVEVEVTARGGVATGAFTLRVPTAAGACRGEVAFWARRLQAADDPPGPAAPRPETAPVPGAEGAPVNLDGRPFGSWMWGLPDGTPFVGGTFEIDTSGPRGAPESQVTVYFRNRDTGALVYLPAVPLLDEPVAFSAVGPPEPAVPLRSQDADGGPPDAYWVSGRFAGGLWTGVAACGSTLYARARAIAGDEVVFAEYGGLGRALNLLMRDLVNGAPEGDAAGYLRGVLTRQLEGRTLTTTESAVVDLLAGTRYTLPSRGHG